MVGGFWNVDVVFVIFSYGWSGWGICGFMDLGFWTVLFWLADLVDGLHPISVKIITKSSIDS